eukprot:scaffold44561_cov25-Tisochrysis_lutea.AAC.2
MHQMVLNTKPPAAAGGQPPHLLDDCSERIGLLSCNGGQHLAAMLSRTRSDLHDLRRARFTLLEPSLAIGVLQAFFDALDRDPETILRAPTVPFRQPEDGTLTRHDEPRADRTAARRGEGRPARGGGGQVAGRSYIILRLICRPEENAPRTAPVDTSRLSAFSEDPAQNTWIPHRLQATLGSRATYKRGAEYNTENTRSRHRPGANVPAPNEWSSTTERCSRTLKLAFGIRSSMDVMCENAFCVLKTLSANN